MDAGIVTFYLFAGVSLLYVVHFGCYLVGANVYDIWQHRRKHRLVRRPPLDEEEECAATAVWHRPYPAEVPGLVSIVIAAHNEEQVIVRSLDSIGRSSYPYYEVIVADDASTDLTERLVRDYAIRHPEMDLRVYRMRKNVGKGTALSTVLRRHARGEFVMTLDADSLIAAAKGLAWESPRGPMSIDKDTRDVVQTIYIRKVEKVGGELVNVPFDKIENVKDPSRARGG